MTEIVRGHRRGRDWTRVGHGLYLKSDGPSAIAERLRAWSLVLPQGAAFTHLTAAELRGWWLPAPVPCPVFAAVSKQGSHPARRGLLVSRHPLLPATELSHGVRVTSASETLLATARDLGVLDLVLMADSALRLGHCTVADLAAAADQRRRGARRLRTVLPLLDARSESPWESVMRVLHRAADIDVEPQRHLLDAAGRFVARADLWLVGTRRIHEYDGEVHRDLAVHRKDLERDRRLVEAGWQRCGFTAAELLRGGSRIIAAVDTLLGRDHDPRRAARWRALVDDSLFGEIGRARAAARWYGK